MATITPTLTTFPGGTSAAYEPGDGVCLFFYDAKGEFYPAGIGSALGYTMYTGPVVFNAGGEEGTINGIPRAYLGIGFDVKGNFSTTNNSKTGPKIVGTENSVLTSCPVTTLTPNTITTRGGELSAYKVVGTTPNLSTYPLSGSPDETYGEPNTWYKDSPSKTLHQSVASRDDIEFTRVKVIIQNKGKRIRVEMKDNTTGKYHPYQIIDLDSGLGERLLPYQGITTLRAGLAFSTSNSVMNCEIKNFSSYGVYSNTEKTQGYIQPQSTSKYRVALSADCP